MQNLNVYAPRLIPKDEPFAPGHRACIGCGEALAVRLASKAMGKNVIIVNATGCMEIISSQIPNTSWKVPWIHTLFENTAAVASGVESGLKAMMRKGRIPQEEINVVAIAGDGATLDIGLQALSGAMERGHNFLYICFDNEAYMNTGIQRSSATPVRRFHHHLSRRQAEPGASSPGKRTCRPSPWRTISRTWPPPARAIPST